VTISLAERAQELLDAMRDALASGGAIETWLAYETPEGGLALLEDCYETPESLRWTRGAQRVWRVRRIGSRLVAEGFAGSACCRLDAPAPRNPVLQLLNRSIPLDINTIPLLRSA
jgi:hypothetical protein